MSDLDILLSWLIHGVRVVLELDVVSDGWKLLMKCGGGFCITSI